MNAITNITPAPLVYKGEIIAERGDMLSLTNMWKAEDGKSGRAPSDWLSLPSTKEFVASVEAAHNAGFSGIITKRGKNGGTFAHWQIGLAYAKYLSPEFHMWCNQVVRERMEGQAKSVATLPPDVMELIRRDDGISRMLAHKVTGMESTIQALASAVAAIAAVVQPPAAGFYITGKTAGQIWHDAGFPQLKITRWFSNRLCEMGCQMDHGRRIPTGLSRAKLFDPDRAENWLKNGGRLVVERYIAERQGQKVLRLISGGAS